MTPAPLPLWRALSPLLPEPAPVAGCSGPRRWWPGPLDVEGLALGSVQAVATALEALDGRGDGSASPERFGVPAEAVAASFGSFGHLRVDGNPCAGFAPLSGFFPTSDGWIRTHANYPHHEQALRHALEISDTSGDTAREAVAAALTATPALEAEARIVGAGGIAAAVRTPEVWARAQAAAGRDSGPWIDLHTHPGSGRRPFSPASGPRPLQGLRVVAMTRVIAGPSAARLLGALGAEVLRIDPPQLPELWDHHLDTGFDTRSAQVDFRDPEGLQAMRSLLPAADVVIQGYRPDALRKYGLDPQTLVAEHPHLCVVSLDAWEGDGPSRARRGFDSIVQAASGIAYLYGGDRDGTWRPGALPVQALDHATGMGMAAAAVALLAARRDDLAGRAHLSLSRTAHELLGAPGVDLEPVELPAPQLRRARSGDGRMLEFVAPPLAVDGCRLEFTSAPESYGSAAAAWR